MPGPRSMPFCVASVYKSMGDASARCYAPDANDASSAKSFCVEPVAGRREDEDCTEFGNVQIGVRLLGTGGGGRHLCFVSRPGPPFASLWCSLRSRGMSGNGSKSDLMPKFLVH